MGNFRNDKSSSTISIRLMCAIVFVVFSFCWLYYFQADVLMMSQHVLSKGLTHYNPLVGAVLITLLLGVIQYVVYGVIHLTKRFHALTYLPSMLILGMLSSVNPIGVDGIEVGFSWYTPILVIVCWWILTRMGRLAQEVEYDKAFALFSQPMWINMLIMAFLMICVAWIGNSNAVLHYRMKVERCLIEGNIDGALKVGKKSLESDANLTMLRMYALARKGTMGESLFEYPVEANSSQMLPTDSLSTLMMYPVDSLYRFLGARPASRMTPMRYLELLERRDSVPNPAVADYQLCGYLIDRQLDKFASEIERYYTINDSLPRHYREALTLYTHLRAHPVVVYHQTVMDVDYNNLRELEKKYPQLSERKGKVEEQYRNTYWYYYEYRK